MENRPVTDKDLRIFGAGILIIAGAIGSLLFAKGSFTAAWILAGFAFLGLMSLGIPLLIMPVYTIFRYLGLVLGWINTRLLLGLLFYVIFAPLSLFFRIIRRDPLARGFDRQAETYWTPVQDSSDDPEQFEKQF